MSDGAYITDELGVTFSKREAEAIIGAKLPPTTPTRTPGGHLTANEEFRLWVRTPAARELYGRFVEVTEAMLPAAIAIGAKKGKGARLSADMVCHKIRADYMIEHASEDPFEVNNNRISRLERLAVRLNPQWPEGLFQERALRS